MNRASLVNMNATLHEADDGSQLGDRNTRSAGVSGVRFPVEIVDGAVVHHDNVEGVRIHTRLGAVRV